MINIEINFDKVLEGRIKFVEGMEIAVGIENKSAKAAIAAPLSDGTRNLPNYSKGMKVRKVAGRDPSYTIAEQIEDLEHWGLFSGVMDDSQSSDVLQIIDALQDAFTAGQLSQKLENRIKNAARALIRNRIIEKRLGDNSSETASIKGRDMPLLDTGTMFTAIRAWVKV